ncbi:GTP-binding protein [Lachnellula suecica]|uniref:GTP-binding protein n=1 Tax=Lachnellula suecica TaxID=602035 RepID=A0A8T9C984_9HELO|nr:GTP-binding protein [Lachnellula suecica]
MASKGKQLPHERRKGESALSEFADYVEKQQALRYPSSVSAAATSTNTAVENHAELDDLLDSLDLADESPAVRLKGLLLSQDEETLVKFVKLLEQRIEEGRGETLFEVGFENNGDSMGLNKEDWDAAIKRLAEAARQCRADCRILLTKHVGGEFEAESAASEKETDCSGKILIRQHPASVEEVIETRIAVVGNVDAGKSTMLGVLVKGGLDDGRGKARVNLFRHKHEIESGRTSSVGMEIMGFDTMGKVVASDVPGRKLSWEEIGKRSAKHLGIALALNVPVMVVITKIDICPPQILEQTIKQITQILKSPGARKIPIFIKNREEFPFVGTVVSGIIKSGVIHAGDTVLIGPDSLGQFTTTNIRSIERKRISVPAASAGQSASFALKRVRRKDVRKGMVVLPKLEQNSPKVYREFVAEVLILSHATTIKTKYQAMLHVGPVSQTCAIIDIDRSYIRTGDRATVAFRFVQRPEYLAPGDRLLFREGRTKGLGIVKSVGYDPKKPLNPEAAKDDGKAVEGAPAAGAD